MDDAEKRLADLYRAGALELSAKTERAIRQAADREFPRGGGGRHKLAARWAPALALAAGLVMGIAIHALLFPRSGDTRGPAEIHFEMRGSQPIPDRTVPSNLRDDPHGWLRWIAEKLEAGEIDRAAAALQEFQRTFPNFSLDDPAAGRNPAAR